MSIHVFGLTGGIGSGKSVVAGRLRERRLPVVDADLLAREVVAPGTDGLAEVVRGFGEQVLTSQGELDREAMANLVFNDETARQRLNAITHPRVREMAQARFRQLEADGQPLACYEAALLVENDLTETLRPLVVVTASEATRIARVAARDSCTEEEVRLRMGAQLPLDDQAKLADFVIDNNGSLQASRARTDQVLQAIRQQLGIDAARYPLPR